MIQIDVRTPDCDGDEYYIHRLPTGTDIADVIKAIGLLYEDVQEIHIYLKED